MEQNEVPVKEGQCGLCAHFGKDHDERLLMKVRKTHTASLNLIEECDHPMHAPLHLRVNAVSGCDGFTPVSF